MAAKEVKREVLQGPQEKIQKEAPRKGRHLKRSVRKTLGAVFLASAIAVAAIPTEGLQAADEVRPANRLEGKKVTSYLKGTKEVDGAMLSSVPVVTSDDPIYTTGDGRYQFAFTYEDENKTGNQIAIILKFNYTGDLPNGLLEVPNSVDAYKQYDTGSTAQGYAAVNRSGEFLYYEVEVPTIDKVTKLPVYVEDPNAEDKILRDEDGNPVQQTHTEYWPCYYDSRREWENLGEGDFYYRTDDPVDENGEYTYEKTMDNVQKQRIHDAKVAYIGNQTVKVDEKTNRWTVGGFVTEENKQDGAFANKSNIKTLILGKDLSGIGDYAFYGCASISRVEVGNGMTTLGNYAFADCIGMKEFVIDFASNLRLIGDHAFYNCYNLQSFTMPTSVQKLGDSAFENCRNMTQMLLNGVDNDGAVRLNEIGYDVFKGCRSLESLTFPETLGEVVDVTTFQGCDSLKFIATESQTFDIVPGEEDEDEGKGDDPEYTLADFKKAVPSTFYFRGPQGRKLHQTATANEFAFSYYDRNLGYDVYELTVEDSDGNKAIYQVNSKNELVHHEFIGKLSTVELPAAIGPYGINAIGEYTFQNNCDIEKVVIPGTISQIAPNAFKGCHNLEDVIWNNPNPNLIIGEGAFKTQDISTNTHTSCPQPASTPVLNFIGPISDTAKPFLYAMEASENINYGDQVPTYITYYSGWPSNLAVRYDPETKKNTLVDYPTFQDLAYGEKYKVKESSTSGGYAYITKDYETAAENAYLKYKDEYTVDPTNKDDTKELTQNERLILDAVFNIVLPASIEAIGVATDEDGKVITGDDGKAKGLFEYKESEKEDDLDLMKVAGDRRLKTITAYGLTEVADRAFAGCKYLTTVTLSGNTQSIGTHAFEGCVELTTVNLPATVDTLGIRPFADCTNLSNVNFNRSPYFSCDNSIIYELGEGGNKEKLVEYLCGRNIGTVRPDEVAGILELYPEAFMGTNVGTVDLSSSLIADVPVSAFQNTLGLYSVTLPEYTCLSIGVDAFSDSSIKLLHIPDSVTFIDNDAFRDMMGNDKLTDLKQLEFECAVGSAAAIYADKNNIKWSPYVPIRYYTVEFLDWDDEVLKTETVEGGHDATPPTAEEMAKRPGKEGHTFMGEWDRPYTNVSSNVTTRAVYVKDSEVYYTITYWYDYATVYKTQDVRKGYDAFEITDPIMEGYTFQGWVIFGGEHSGEKPVWTNIQSDMTVIAVFALDLGPSANPNDPNASGSPNPNDPNASGSPNPNDPNASGSPNPNDPNVSGSPNPNDPNVSGSPRPNDPNASGSPNPNDPNASGSPNPNDPNGSTAKRYILTVQNGSGSGSYAEGDQPIIIANDPPSGQEFDFWSVSPTDVKIASLVLSASVITMPAGDVTVTAHYKAKSGSGGSGDNTGNGSNTQRPNGNSGTVTNGGTTVVIDKNGLSNTGVVSATVHGSSDNFTIKISESAVATEAVLRALMAEYGDNLDNIKFFPMDITLYDSTGTTKITDTTGLSVSITLPLPDSMITYAGNNRVASVRNDRLERLSARFTTIQGVSCITFTAEHFSPYVIYVNTGDLSSGLVSDSTPKTGDFIHPKWFLSIALACLSFIFFMQKDTKKEKKVKVKVRA